MATPAPTPADLDPDRFAIHRFEGRGFRQAYVHEGPGGVPLLCVHGWPETKRIWWRVIEPLAAAGFEVIVPDLRGFGDCDVGPTASATCQPQPRPPRPAERGSATSGWCCAAATSAARSVQDLALRFPDVAERMVLFNSPLPYDKDAMAGMDTRPGREPPTTSCARAPTPTAWPPSWPPRAAPPLHRHLLHVPVLGPPRRVHGDAAGWALRRTGQVDFHTEPFGDAAKLRASFGGYESASTGRPERAAR